MSLLVLHQLRGASAEDNAFRQRGFALPEAMIAAVIAAGVAIATAQSLSAAARLAYASNEFDAQAREAKLILARLDAGMDETDATQGMKGWNVTKLSIEQELADDDHTLELWTISNSAEPPFEVQRIRLSNSP